MNSLLLPVLILVGCYLTYLWWHHRTIRINETTRKYLAFRSQSTFSNGLEMLRLAGAYRLWTKQEMASVCREITETIQHHPKEVRIDPKSNFNDHPNWYSGLSNKDILPFLKWCHRHNQRINTASALRSSVCNWKDGLLNPRV